MNNLIYYNNKYPQDYGIIYMDTPEADLLSIDKLIDVNKGIRIYGLISCIGVFIIPTPNKLIGGHFFDKLDIDFLTKMDNIIMNTPPPLSPPSGAADSLTAERPLPKGLMYLFYRNTNVSGQLNDININKNFLKNRYEKFFNKIIEIGLDRSYVNVTFMEFIDEIMWDNLSDGSLGSP